MGVPRMAVNDVDVSEHAGHRQVAEHRVKELRVPRILRREPELRMDSPHRQVTVVELLIAEAENLDLVVSSLDAGQLAREILDVNARAAINVRWILIGQNRDTHGRRLRERRSKIAGAMTRR